MALHLHTLTRWGRFKYYTSLTLSKLWCKIPRCWKYNWQGYYMVHYICWGNTKIDVWAYYIPPGAYDR